MATGDVKVSNTTNRSFKCAVFDGINDTLSIPYSLDKLGAFTFSGWMRPRTTTGHQALIDSNGTKYVYIKIDIGGGVTMYTNGLSDNSLTSSAAVDVGKWNHICGTYDGAVKVLYVNGVSKSEAATGVTDVDATTTYLGSIGNNYWMDGSIAKIQIYNVSLTAAEVASLYLGQEVSRGLIHSYNFMKDDYTDSAGSMTATNAGTFISIDDDAIAAAVKTQRVTANDKWMCYKGMQGQVGTVEIEEVP